MAPDGQLFTHAGFSQWLHNSGRKASVVRGNVPVDWYSTSPSRLSRWFQCALPGTSFDLLQLTVQVWQPTQCWVLSLIHI